MATYNDSINNSNVSKVDYTNAKDCFHVNDPKSKAKFLDDFNFSEYTYVDDFSVKNQTRGATSTEKVEEKVANNSVQSNDSKNFYHNIASNSNTFSYSPIVDNSNNNNKAVENRKAPSPIKLTETKRNSFQHEYQEFKVQPEPPRKQSPSPALPPIRSPNRLTPVLKPTSSTTVRRTPPPTPVTTQTHTPRLLAIEICIPHQARVEQVTPYGGSNNQQLDWCKNLPGFQTGGFGAAGNYSSFQQYPSISANYGQYQAGSLFGAGSYGQASYMPQAPAWNQTSMPQFPPNMGGNFGASPIPFGGGQNFFPPQQPPMGQNYCPPPMGQNNCPPPPQKVCKIGKMCPLPNIQQQQCNQQAPMYIYKEGCCRAFCSCLSKICRSDCCRSDCQPGC